MPPRAIALLAALFVLGYVAGRHDESVAAQRENEAFQAWKLQRDLRVFLDRVEASALAPPSGAVAPPE